MQKIEFELPLDVQGTPFQKRVCRRLLRLLQACSFFHGLHELRLSGKSGEFRVFYLIKVGEAIYIIHACTKKKQAIDMRTTDLLKNRIRSIDV